MGYLVFCTTCNGKMSNNADVCPHCAENNFFLRREWIEWDEQPCDPVSYPDADMSRCSCRGWLYAKEIRVHASAEQQPGARLMDGMWVAIPNYELENSDFQASLRRNECRLTRIGRAFNWFYKVQYHRITCPKCKGTGKQRIARKEYDWEDIRKRV